MLICYSKNIVPFDFIYAHVFKVVNVSHLTIFSNYFEIGEAQFQWLFTSNLLKFELQNRKSINVSLHLLWVVVIQILLWTVNISKIGYKWHC